MSLYKTVDYSKLTFETLRNDLSVNKDGDLSILYRYILSCTFYLQSYWDAFNLWRITKRIIANCKWQIGQVQYVLNYLIYGDATLTYIYITQQKNAVIYLNTNELEALDDLFFKTNELGYNPATEIENFAPTNDDTSTVLALVTINVPGDMTVTQKALLVDIIEQIKITGIKYVINYIIEA